MTAQYFVLERKPREENETGRTDVMPKEGFSVGGAPRCPSCGGFIGLLKWLPPYRVEVETWGERFGDFAFPGGGEWFLVSDRFRNIYLHSGLTGLCGFDPVEVVKISRHNKRLRGSTPRYYKVDVVKSQAVVDQSASGFEWSADASICPACLLPLNGIIRRWKQIIIQPQEGMTEDIFIPRGMGEIIAMRSFKNLCEAH